MPLWQKSPAVQKRPSSQGCPSPEGTAVQPAPGMHLPMLHGESRNEQSSGTPPRQAPPWQKLPTMQVSVGSQEDPSLTGACMQPMAASSQTPTVHGPAEGQVT